MKTTNKIIRSKSTLYNNYKTRKTNKKSNKNSNKNSSSILHSRKNSITKSKKTKNISKINNSSNSNSSNSRSNNNDNDNNDINDKVDDNDNNTQSFSIGFTSGRFLSRTKSIVRRGPKLKKKDLFGIFLSDNYNRLKTGKIIKNNKLDKHIFNDNKSNCICENIFNKPIADDCKCDNMIKYSSQGKSGAAIYSIKCQKENNILKTILMSNYYMKMRTETKNYVFIEFDGFSIQTLINTYLYRELPNNTVKIYNSGVCKNIKNKISTQMHGYNLMEEADLGSGKDFLIKLMASIYDEDFNINDEDMRYIAITNFLLQVVLIIGHLQSSSLEFFHGDFKPENVFVKRINKKTVSHYIFKVFGKEIKVKNMGFAVLIADFDKSSITIKDDFNNKKYRIISPILFKPFLTSNVNNIIKKYGDIDPDNIKKKSYEKNGVKIEKLFISNFIPRKLDPTITILRSAGVKLFRDFDLYIFFIRLIENGRVRQYFIDKRYTHTIMSFMSKSFQNVLLSKPVKESSQTESAYAVVEIFQKIKEPMNNIFTDNYIDRLKALNYKLFR